MPVPCMRAMDLAVLFPLARPSFSKPPKIAPEIGISLLARRYLSV